MPTPGSLIADIKASRGPAKSPNKLKTQIATARGSSDERGGVSLGDESESDLAFLSCFSEEDRTTLSSIKEWMVTATPSLTAEPSDVHVCVRSIGTDASKPILCIHGLGKDRSAALFGGFWPGLVAAGYRVITFDMPGHGKAGGKPLAARGGKDGELIVAVLHAFRLTDVCVLADAGGSSAFLRAFQLAPEIFGPHHVLLNPITTDAGAPLKLALERHGVDLLVLMADGWGATDTPFSVANCGVFFEFIGMAPERAELITLVPPRGSDSINSPGIKPMRDAKWLCGEHATGEGEGGGGASKPFVLLPSDECVEEVLGVLRRPRRKPVREDGGPHAPTTCALMAGGPENENFKVYIRIRPMLAREEGAGDVTQVEDVTDFPRSPPPQRLTLLGAEGGSSVSGSSSRRDGNVSFIFDRCFSPGTQAELCETVAAPLVAAVVGGINATLFAYGQTGSGKTFTMEGPVGQEGCVQYATTQLFAALPAGHVIMYQYVQLYNDEFLDLLEPPTEAGARKKLAIDEGKRFVCMRGATVAKASSPSAMLEDVQHGASFRATGATNMNDASSRSHAILIIVCAPESHGSSGGGGGGSGGSSSGGSGSGSGWSSGLGDTGAAFYLVDLAGSERTKRSGVQGKAFDEAAAINKALSALGRVVTSLVEKDGQRASHISYKDNPLTQLLKSGLGGNSKTALVACITSASDSTDESLNTLRFATQASHVKNKVAKKEARDEQAAKDAAIATSGNELVLDSSGKGVVPLSDGKQLAVRGWWGGNGDDGLPTILCIHDFGRDGSQFDGLIAALSGSAHVLVPDFEFKSEKWERGADVMGPPVATCLELLTWLGVGKVSCIVGADFGAAVAGAFKKSHKTRCQSILLYFVRLDLDDKEWAAKKKSDGMFETNLWMGPLCYFCTRAR